MRRKRYSNALYNHNMVSREGLLSVRKKIINAFKVLRKKGLIAKANFSCCQNCAGHAIADYLETVSAEKRAKVKGVVYWHRQDDISFKEDGKLYLAYGNVDTVNCGVVGIPSVEVGEIVCDTLKKFEIPYQWTGNPNNRILITIP